MRHWGGKSLQLLGCEIFAVGLEKFQRKIGKEYNLFWGSVSLKKNSFCWSSQMSSGVSLISTSIHPALFSCLRLPPTTANTLPTPRCSIYQGLSLHAGDPLSYCKEKNQKDNRNTCQLPTQCMCYPSQHWLLRRFHLLGLSLTFWSVLYIHMQHPGCLEDARRANSSPVRTILFREAGMQENYVGGITTLV